MLPLPRREALGPYYARPGKAPARPGALARCLPGPGPGLGAPAILSPTTWDAWPKLNVSEGSQYVSQNRDRLAKVIPGAHGKGFTLRAPSLAHPAEDLELRKWIAQWVKFLRPHLPSAPDLLVSKIWQSRLLSGCLR